MSGRIHALSLLTRSFILHSSRLPLQNVAVCICILKRYQCDYFYVLLSSHCHLVSILIDTKYCPYRYTLDWVHN